MLGLTSVAPLAETHSAVVSGGSQNYTLNPDTDFSASELCTVTVFAAQVTDTDTVDPPDNMDSDFSSSFIILTPECGNSATLIHVIQGSGTSSPEDGNIHTVEGIVVGDFQANVNNNLRGFFIQEEDGDVDTNPMTSEGIFVYDGSTPAVDVAAGDVVRVTGEVDEFNDLTELTNVSRVEICSPGGVASAVTVNLPIADVAEWEYYEGMLFNIPQTLYATGNYDWGRYGEVDLSVSDRLFNPTNVAAPGAAADAVNALNDRSRIQLEDGRTAQNPIPVPYLGVDNTLRAGDTIPSLTAVLHYSFDSYEAHPVGSVNFTRVNTRDATPPSVGGTLKVASFNVLNYFSTIDDSGSICGPAGVLGCRGADTAAEFTRQRDKIISAITIMDADIIGLMEIENHATDAALQDLVAGLNAATAPGTYALVATGPVGTDAIKVAYIYKPGTVSLVGAHAILDSSVDPTFIDTKNRPALAQTFEQISTGEKFTAVVNHLKSKGSNCNSLGDPDTGDQQGNCNLTRTSAATAIVNWLATDPTSSGDPDFLIMGDLNAYAMEDPIVAIETAGYINLIKSFLGSQAYSYVFFGEAGYLDHALANSSLNSQVTGVTEWHINGDEPSALNYNDHNQPILYQPDAYAASDHDPVIVGLNLAVIADYGDLPASYGTASHTGNGSLRLGPLWTIDDGVDRISPWVGDGSSNADLTIVVNGGSGWLAGWVDWNGSGSFDNPSERVVDQAVTAGSNAISFAIPGSYVTGTTVNARFRLYTAAPTLVPTSAADPIGDVSGGEVEDFIWQFGPTAVSLQSFNAGQQSVAILLTLGATLLGMMLVMGLLRKRNGR